MEPLQYQCQMEPDGTTTVSVSGGTRWNHYSISVRWNHYSISVRWNQCSVKTVQGDSEMLRRLPRKEKGKLVGQKYNVVIGGDYRERENV